MAKAALCGSVNLATRDDVFRTVASIAGTSVKRITDGETDERAMWTDMMIPRLEGSPQFEPAEDERAVKRAFRLREGVDPADVRIELAYADTAIESYAAFAAFKQEGVIPAATRFQVSMPTAMALTMYIIPSDVPAVFPALERALLEQASRIAAAIPHDQLAIQWDIAAEIAVIEGYLPNLFGDGLAVLADMAARLGAAVPGDADLGYHLCYGDEPGADGLGHHFMEPADLSKLVILANELTERTTRPINWIHMPVPIERDDDAYFAPLADLALAPQTELYLGLVHREDGVEGAQRRADTAARHVASFGVGTECGMGREPREAIPELIRTHVEVTTPA